MQIFRSLFFLLKCRFFRMFSPFSSWKLIKKQIIIHQMSFCHQLYLIKYELSLWNKLKKTVINYHPLYGQEFLLLLAVANSRVQGNTYSHFETCFCTSRKDILQDKQLLPPNLVLVIGSVKNFYYNNYILVLYFAHSHFFNDFESVLSNHLPPISPYALI